MRRWLMVWIALASCAGLVALAVDLGPDQRLLALVCAAGGAWLLVVLTLPWDLHFQAREVLREIDRALGRGVTPEADRFEVQRIVRRTLWIAIGLHLATAIAVGAAGLWTREALFDAVAAVFLATAALRPVGAWYAHTRERLRRTLGEVAVPPVDAIALKSAISGLEIRLDRLEEEVRIAKGDAEARSAAATEEQRRLDRRLDQMGRKFEETLERLTDNREILAGIRAFLRLVRE